MTIKMIVAMDNKNAIGKDNQLLWNIPSDMKHFKNTTFGKTVVMGRKTFDSIGKPLLNRKNIVLTKLNPNIKGCFQTDDINEILKLKEEVFIIGGENTYKQFLPYTKELIVTHVLQDYPDADSFFPEINSDEWDTHKILEYNFTSLPNYIIIHYKRLKTDNFFKNLLHK